jgi:arginase family enzyme
MPKSSLDVTTIPPAVEPSREEALDRQAEIIRGAVVSFDIDSLDPVKYARGSRSSYDAWR